MFIKAKAALFSDATVCITTDQRPYGAIRHALGTLNICLQVSSSNLILPPTWLPMTPVHADNTKIIHEYDFEKEKVCSGILAAALNFAMDSGGGLMLEVDERGSANTNADKIEEMETKVCVSDYMRAWWLKYLMALEMFSWAYDETGDAIEVKHVNTVKNGKGERETAALVSTQATMSTSYEFNVNNNIEPSQGQQHAPNKPDDDTSTITFRSAAKATLPPSFITVVIGVLASIFCLITSSHSDPDNESMPPSRPVYKPECFQPLPFKRGRNQAVPKRPQPSNLQEPSAADTEKSAWSGYKANCTASNPSVSVWTSTTSRCKGEVPALAFPAGESASSEREDAHHLSKTLGNEYNTDNFSVEMKEKRSEELMQETFALDREVDVKGEMSSGLSPSREETEGGLWLDWEEEPTPILEKRHRAPAMSGGLVLATLPPQKTENPSREPLPKEETGGLWLEWDEEEEDSTPLPRHRHRAPASTRSHERRGTPPPEAKTVSLDLKGPPVPEHITPVTSLDSGCNLEIMPGSYTDSPQDTPRPQSTPVFGSPTAPVQQLQVIAPSRSLSSSRRSFYLLPTAQLHGGDVFTFSSYPLDGDECIPYSLERYLFQPIRPPFLHDHNNIVGPRVLAHTRPRGEVQMRRIEQIPSRAYEGKVSSTTFGEMNLGPSNDDVGSSEVEDESYADDSRGPWGARRSRREWF